MNGRNAMNEEEILRLQQKLAEMEKDKAEMEKDKAELERKLAESEKSRGMQARDITAEGDVVSGVKYENNYAAPPKDETDPGKLREWYLKRVIQETGILTLQGIDPQSASCRVKDACLNLDAVYTALLTQTAEQEKGGGHRRGDIVDMFEGKESRKLSALEVLDQHPKLALLGDPGSGKSTFVNFVALCLAGENLGREDANIERMTRPLPDDEGNDREKPQPWNQGPLIPVRVVLRDFAARMSPADDGCASDLWSFIESELGKKALGEYAVHLKKELQEKGGLILLDGLDEVPDADHRREGIKRVVEEFEKTFTECRILLTSRTYAYQKDQWRIPRFFETVLLDFSKGQIIRFIDQWYSHSADLMKMDQENAQSRAQTLKREIFANDRLLELAERPLLLTLMANLHAWRGGSLPEKREELYSDAVDLLLDRWESRKIRQDAQGNTLVEPGIAEFLKTGKDKLRKKLNELAFKVHRDQPVLQGTADIPEGVLLPELIKLSSEKESVDLNALIRFLEQRAGLLLSHGNIYTFPHRTFQEYLAACHLTGETYPDEIADLALAEPERWREVALLAGAKAARGSLNTIWQLAGALCVEGPDEEEIGLSDSWGAHLAGRALAEILDFKEEITRRNHLAILQRVRKRLVIVIEGDRLPGFERALAGRHLAALGDPRKPVMSLANMEFCLVPGGGFHMGSNEYDHEKPPHLNEHLQHDYWLSRHPVTNSQYGEFVEAGGYAERRYWDEAEKEGFWKEGKFKGRYDSNFRDRPNNYGSPFNFPNHPVVGVTWYEALAFTRWLTEHWRNQGFIRKDRVVCLPSEAEWEKAARGGVEIPEEPVIIEASSGSWSEKRAAKPNEMPEKKYPWGDEIDKEKANYSKTGIGTTSAVGCFSMVGSPYGCLELAGNVWEWTRSLWGKGYEPVFKYPYEPSPEREDATASPEIRRVLRGGAFHSQPENLRCAFRYGYSPNCRYDDVGFRCCVCAPNTSVLW